MQRQTKRKLWQASQGILGTFWQFKWGRITTNINYINKITYCETWEKRWQNVSTKTSEEKLFGPCFSRPDSVSVSRKLQNDWRIFGLEALKRARERTNDKAIGPTVCSWRLADYWLYRWNTVKRCLRNPRRLSNMGGPEPEVYGEMMVRLHVL